MRMKWPMWRSRTSGALPLTLALAVVGCTDATAGLSDAGGLVVTGSSTIAPVIGDLAKRFEAANPGVRVDVQTGGSSRGLADVRSGLAEIGMVSRALGGGETDVTAHLLARDGVAMIVHASNPVASLTSEQVLGIYTGRIRNWRALGGSDAPITVVHKADGRSTQKVFLSHFGIEAVDVKASVVIGDNEQGIKSVAGNPDAVGYVSIGTAEISASRGAQIKLVAQDGVEASIRTVASGAFPVVRELNLVTRGTPTPLAQKFLVFALSEQANATIEAHAFVAVD